MGEMLVEGHMSISQAASSFNLSPTTLKRYKKAARTGRTVLAHGRPPRLDNIGKDNIVSLLRKRRQEQDAVSLPHLIELVSRNAQLSDERRGLTPKPHAPSNRTLLTIRTENRISVGVGQRKTKARIEAERDPRNAISEAVLLEAFQTGRHPCLITNTDSTQYSITRDAQGRHKLCWVG